MLFLVVSILIIATIAFDRYQMISSIQRHAGVKKYAVYSIGVWVASILLVWPQFYFSDVIIFDGGGRVCKLKE